MNRPFLKQAVGWFIKDNPELVPLNRRLQGIVEQESYDHLVEFMEDLKLNYNDIYESVCQYDSSDSHKLTYFLLDQYYSEQFPDIFESCLSIDYDNGCVINDDDIKEEVVLSLSGGVGLALIPLGLLLATNIGTSAIARFFRMVGDLGKGVDSLLDKMGSRGRVMRSVLFDRAEKCSKQCGIEKLHYAAGFSYAIGGFGFKEADKQVACLSGCYVDQLINIILLLVDAYQQCIVSTGELPPTIADKSSLLAQKPIGASCVDIYNQLRDNVAAYEEALDRLFDNSRDKADVDKSLNSKLADLSKKNILNVMREKPTYNKPRFQSQQKTQPRFGRK